MDYVLTVLLPQLLHGLVFGAALGLLALGLTVIFGLLGVMNFAHGDPQNPDAPASCPPRWMQRPPPLH